MRVLIASLMLGSAAMFCGGCEVRARPAEVTVATPAVAVEGPSVEVDAPLVEGPGVFAIDVEPPIAERQYVYDVGFPPGVYLSGGFYYYGGHRYEHDVFINRVVHRNITEHKFTNVEENRRAGQRIETQHREVFQKTGGKRLPAKRAEHGKPEHEEHR